MHQQHDGQCHVEVFEKSLDRAALADAQAAYLAISGMGCPRCATRVNNSLLQLDGVLISEVALEDGLAVAAYDPRRLTVEDLLAAVSGAGRDGRHHYHARLLLEIPALEALKS